MSISSCRLHSIGIIHESEMKKIKVFDVLPAHLSTICHALILLRGVYSVWSREEEQRESIKYEKAAASHTILSKQPFRKCINKKPS